MRSKSGLKARSDALRGEQLEPRLAMAVAVGTPIADLTVGPAEAVRTISLSGAFDQTDISGTVVQFTTNSAAPNGRFFVELFDASGPVRTTPLTAANFLRYVDNGLYANTILHRTVPGFITQGGGFSQPSTAGRGPTAIPAYAAVANEFGNHNLRGTIAMAKLGGDADSATNQWFVNLADNTTNLDFQNGGFTAFGRVLGAGMSVVDSLAAIPTFDMANLYANGALTDLPLRRDPSAPPASVSEVSPNQFATISSISRAGELVYSVTSSDPTLMTAAVENGTSVRVAFAAGRSGTARLTVRAASVFDPTDFVEDVIEVRREPAPPAEIPPPAAPGLQGRFVSARAEGTPVTHFARPVLTGLAERDDLVTVRAQRGANAPQILGTARAAADGRWQLATPRDRAFADGGWTLTATRTTRAGVASQPSTPFRFTVDLGTPAPTGLRLAAESDLGVSSSDGVTSDTLPSFTGVAEPGATVRLISGGRSIGTATADATTGQFQIQPDRPLSSGARFVSAVATDIAGNMSSLARPIRVVIEAGIAPPSRPLLIDALPSSQFGSPIKTASPTPMLGGFAKPGSQIRIFASSANQGTVELGVATADARGAWRFTVPAAGSLSNGLHGVYAQAIARSGATSTLSSPLLIRVGTVTEPG